MYPLSEEAGSYIMLIRAINRRPFSAVPLGKVIRLTAKDSFSLN
jgi:hypothetical protein